MLFTFVWGEIKSFMTSSGWGKHLCLFNRSGCLYRRAGNCFSLPLGGLYFQMSSINSLMSIKTSV